MATIFTDSAEAVVTNRIKAGGTEPLFVAWGTGAGTAAKADTTLFTESAEARVSGTSTRTTTGSTNDTYQVVGTITASAARTITNAGTFDASTAGNIFVKGDHASTVLASGESIQYTITLQFT